MPEATRVSTPVTQAGHNFTRGFAVAFNGTNWVQASTGGHGVGVVGSIYDANSFEFVQLGELDGLDNLVPGAAYYPSTTGISTVINGSPVGVAYTDRVLFVGSAPGQGASASEPVDTSNFVSPTTMAAAIAAAVAAQAAIDNVNHLKSIEGGAVISIVPDHSGVVFLKSDGKQVVTV